MRNMFKYWALAAAFAITVPMAYAEPMDCPDTAQAAALVANSPEPFSDEAAYIWSACPVSAARLFAAAYLGETEPTKDAMDAIIALLDDPSDRVRAAALVAAANQADALAPYLPSKLDDPTPSSVPGLSRGDIALAALEAIYPERPYRLPLALRDSQPAVQPSPEEGNVLVTEFTDLPPESRAEAMRHAASFAEPVSAFKAIEHTASSYYAVVKEDGPTAEDYETAAVTAFDRALKTAPEAVIENILPNLLYQLGRHRDGMPDLADAVFKSVDPQFLMSEILKTNRIDSARYLAEKSAKLPGRWSEHETDVNLLASRVVLKLLAEGNPSRASLALAGGSSRSDRTIVPDAGAFAAALIGSLQQGILDQQDMERMLDDVPGLSPALQQAAEAGGRDGSIASALLSCVDFQTPTGEFVDGNWQSCFAASQIASGLSFQDSFDQAMAGGDLCRAAAFAWADPDRGVDKLWDLRSKIKARQPIGPVPAPAIQQVDCGRESLLRLIESALSDFDSPKMEQAHQNEYAQAKASTDKQLIDWDGIQPWESECEPLVMESPNDESGAQTPLKTMLSTIRCLETEADYTIAAGFYKARDRLLAEWRRQIPEQTRLWPQPIPVAPSAPMSPSGSTPKYGPGGLPVIVAMPRPRLEVALDLSLLGGREQTLEELQSRIESGLRKASTGYNTGLFSDGTDGIILLTSRERIRSNGEPFDETRRFTEKGNPKASLADMFASIIKEKPGEFRVIAFVIAKNVNFDENADPLGLPLEQIGEVRTLPPKLALSKVGDRKVTALVYVFERPKGKKVRARKDGPPNAYQHLLAAGVWSALGQPN